MHRGDVEEALDWLRQISSVPEGTLVIAGPHSRLRLPIALVEAGHREEVAQWIEATPAYWRDDCASVYAPILAQQVRAGENLPKGAFFFYHMDETVPDCMAEDEEEVDGVSPG